MRHGRGSRSRAKKEHLYLHLPRNEVASFQGEVTAILGEINSGNGPLFDGLKSVKESIATFNSDNFVVKWFTLQQFLETIPNYGIRDTILRIYDYTRNVRVFAAKINSVIPYLPRIKSVSNYCSRLIEFLTMLKDKSPCGIPEIESFITFIEETKKSNSDIDVGPHHIRAFLNVSTLFSNLDKLIEDFNIIKANLSYIQSINKISALLNKFTSEKFDILDEKININLGSKILPFNRNFESRIRITSQENFLLVKYIEELSNCGIEITTDKSMSMKHEHLYPPNLSEQFSCLEANYSAVSEMYTAQFIQKMHELLVFPLPESDVLELYAEAISVKFTNNINGETNEYIDRIADSLKVIYKTTQVFAILDYCGTVPYGNSIRLMYMRTITNMLLKTDDFNTPLSEQPEIEILNRIKTRIKETSTFVGFPVRRWVFQTIRSHFHAVIEYIVRTGNFTFLLNFLFQAEYSTISSSDIEDTISRIKAFDSIPPQISEFLEDLNKVAVKYGESTELPSNADFVISFVSIFSDDPDSFKVSEIKFEFAPLLSQSITKCINENTIYILGNVDYSFLLDKFTPEFVPNFIKLNQSISIFSSEITNKISQMTTYIIQMEDEKAYEILYFLDILTRGSLDKDVFSTLIAKIAEFDDGKIKSITLELLHLWRFMHLRDEIARSIVMGGYSPRVEIAASSLRHFNMKRFLTNFASLTLFLNVVFGGQEDIQPLLKLKDAIEEIPDLIQPLQSTVFSIDENFTKSVDIFKNFDLDIIIDKAKTIFDNLITKKPFNSTDSLATNFEKYVSWHSFRPKIYKKLCKDLNLLMQTYGLNHDNDSLIEQIITYANAASVYYQTAIDISNYSTFVISNLTSISLAKQNVFVNERNDQPDKVLLPLQFCFSQTNPDYITFSLQVLKNSANSIQKDQEFDENLDLILKITQHEAESRDMLEDVTNNSIKELFDKSAKLQNLMQQLSDVRQKVSAEQKKNIDLQKNRQKAIVSKKNEMVKRQSEFFAQYDSFNTENIEISLMFEQLDNRKQPLLNAISEKKAYKEVLLKQKDIMKKTKDGFVKTPAQEASNKESHNFSAYIYPDIITELKEEKQKIEYQYPSKSGSNIGDVITTMLITTPHQFQSLTGVNHDKSISKK